MLSMPTIVQIKILIIILILGNSFNSNSQELELNFVDSATIKSLPSTIPFINTKWTFYNYKLYYLVTNNKNSIVIHNINVIDKKEDSVILKSKKYINDNSDIREFAINEENIIISFYDRVFVFNKNGNYLKTIKFKEPNRFNKYFLSSQNQLYAFNVYKEDYFQFQPGTILVNQFDLKTGLLILKKEIPFIGTEYCVLPNEFVSFKNNQFYLTSPIKNYTYVYNLTLTLTDSIKHETQKSEEIFKVFDSINNIDLNKFYFYRNKKVNMFEIERIYSNDTFAQPILYLSKLKHFDSLYNRVEKVYCFENNILIANNLPKKQFGKSKVFEKINFSSKSSSFKKLNYMTTRNDTTIKPKLFQIDPSMSYPVFSYSYNNADFLCTFSESNFINKNNDPASRRQTMELYNTLVLEDKLRYLLLITEVK